VVRYPFLFDLDPVSFDTGFVTMINYSGSLGAGFIMSLMEIA